MALMQSSIHINKNYKSKKIIRKSFDFSDNLFRDCFANRYQIKVNENDNDSIR